MATDAFKYEDTYRNEPCPLLVNFRQFIEFQSLAINGVVQTVMDTDKEENFTRTDEQSYLGKCVSILVT